MTECMRRPRLYADRLWLEGWREETAALPRMGREAARFSLRLYRIDLGRSWTVWPTARETGRIDALLDAWGC